MCNVRLSPTEGHVSLEKARNGKDEGRRSRPEEKRGSGRAASENRRMNEACLKDVGYFQVFAW